MKINVLLLILLLCSANLIHSDEIGNGVEGWLESRPSVITARAQLSAAREDRAMKFALLLPFKAAAGVDMSIAASGISFDGSVSLAYTFLNADASSSYRKTGYLINASQEYLYWIKQQALYRLMSLFVEQRNLAARLELLDSRKAALEQSTGASRIRFELGGMNQTELNYALSRLTVVQAEYAGAVQELRVLESELENLIGNYEINIPVEGLPFPVNADSEDGSNFIGKRHDILQMQMMLQAAESDVLGVNTILPGGIELTTGGYKLLSGAPEFRIGVDVDIPVFSIDYESRKKEIYSIEKEIIENNLNDYILQEGLRIDQLISDLKSLKDSEGLYEKAVSYSLLALEGIRSEYNAGYKSLFEVLTAQTNYFSTLAGLISVRASIETAKLQYYYYKGELDVDFIRKLL